MMRDEYVIMLYGDGMKLETNLKQTQIQTQKLSLKQQFSLKVLEMNDTQVLDAIVAELEINPRYAEYPRCAAIPENTEQSVVLSKRRDFPSFCLRTVQDHRVDAIFQICQKGCMERAFIL